MNHYPNSSCLAGGTQTGGDFGVVTHFGGPAQVFSKSHQERFFAALRMTLDRSCHPERSEGSGFKLSHYHFGKSLTCRFVISYIRESYLLYDSRARTVAPHRNKLAQSCSTPSSTVSFWF